MRRWGSLAFVAVMLLLMALPAIGLIGKPYRQESADAYVEENVAFRQELITLHAGVCRALWNQSGEDQMLLGREGWLYFMDTMPDVYRRVDIPDADIEKLADRIAAYAAELASRGIGFTFLCAPNKATVYPEYLPYYVTTAGENSVRERLQDALAARGVPFLDAAEILRAHKDEGPLYFRTDTHWNAQGAMLIAEALLEMDIPQYAWEEQAITGDLSKLYLPLTSDTESASVPVIPRAYRALSPIRSMDDMIIRTASDANALRLLVFRDSFGEGLFDMLANHVGALTFTRLDPFESGLAETEPVDHVVIEVAERTLREWLLAP